MHHPNHAPELRFANSGSDQTIALVWRCANPIFAALLAFGFLLLALLLPGSTKAQGKPAPETPLKFADIAENTIPGRYKWTDGTKVSFIVLYSDHTFMNKDGMRFAPYRWNLKPDGLTFTWSRSESHFTNIEAPGVFALVDPKGATVRLEKLPPPTRDAAAEPPFDKMDIIASLTLNSRSQTNGLYPRNTGGDGAIYPASVNGADCYEMVRKEDRPTAYLYLQLDPKLKQQPITNAFVVVEYLDPPAADGQNGQLVVQYDGTGGAYDVTQALNFSGSQTWKEALFFIATAGFTGRQNARADFRLAARAPQLFVRSIKLVVNRIPTERYKFPIILDAAAALQEPQ